MLEKGNTGLTSSILHCHNLSMTKSLSVTMEPEMILKNQNRHEGEPFN